MRYGKKAKKCTTLVLLFVLVTQLLFPNIAMALTTGPTQPEVQSFEPVGTTDMVDMFSGSFVYNIPLMDVEGYPVNISYHGGVTMEQEATWVGLGWNINPGEINRSVRGLPDDFNGDVISKQLNIKPEKTFRAGVGVGGEVFGMGDPGLKLSVSLGANVTFSNYRGTSVDFDLGGGVNVFGCASLGVNIGVGSATGADIDYNKNIGFSTAQLVSGDMGGGIGVGVSQGYSTRSGLKDINLTFSSNTAGGGISSSQSVTENIPVGVKNFVPVITNSSTMNSFYGRIKFGIEGFWLFGYATVNGMYSKLDYNNDGSRSSYGYLYLQNAQSPTPKYESILDFTRDKDGQFNQTMQYLPPANLTYDIYSVTGQGTGGVFRSYRNDFGSVYDPVTSSAQHSYSGGVEVGVLWIFELGGDYTNSNTSLMSGPWMPYVRNFTSDTAGSVYENTYLKQGGELTAVDPQYFTDIGGVDPIDPTTLSSLPATKANSSAQRDPRGNLIYYFTAQEESEPGVGTNPNIISYTTDGFASGPDADAPVTVIPRIGSGPLDHKASEISEIVQLQKDGRRYNFGLPALNHIQKEATFSVSPPTTFDKAKGLVAYSGSDDSPGNGQGLDNYYSSTTTPAYVHSYLLTSVLSADYVDISGDGPTDDDLGSYTKLNYTQKEADYRWKAPYDVGKAQYNAGFLSDPKDDKGSYVMGSREQWMLHSIVTKNFVAEFYTSQRSDALGSTEPIIHTGSYDLAPYSSPLSTPAHSYKLDSIKLYNKHDRFINKTSAVPVKTVYFVYDYSLCSGIPNSSSGGGKLTLKKIYFKYGNSERSMLSPYQFSYGGLNPGYDLSCKDRWGDYKPNNPSFPNYEYPFVNQNDTSNNTYAGAWSLTNISLPSGGMIQSSYESNDYAYVQDKPVNEMFTVQGIGNGPGFSPSTYLYDNLTSQNVYVYFKRRMSSENPRLSFQDNYFHDQSVLYYNFNVRLKFDYEQIKGYANITDINVCPNDFHYGYIKLQPVMPTGTDVNVNPITFTALNTARYSLPGAIYPGAGPDPSFDILGGLHAAFAELVSFFRNPIYQLIKKYDARSVDLSKSFIRLQSPGLFKKGGGQRVKSLLFYDSWNALAGGNESSATYGKKYDYTTTDDYFGTISSGVASYEPLIGGDENPMRQPVPYIVESGSNWPPNDPVSLYQETPIGESLFPPACVGYSKITVSSIHSPIGISSLGIDVYQYYTAKDFPAQVIPTAINTTSTYHFSFQSQENDLSATQGYSLIFNDMHGKPKSVEHYVKYAVSDTRQMMSFQTYNYHMSGGLLDNHVNCLVYDPVGKKMTVKNQQLGMEADVTIDTRQKDEDTKNHTLNANLNFSGFFIFFIPIFFPVITPYPWAGEYHKQFTAATVTKVVQQYGILDNVESFNEGAVTTQTNELFDPKTGQVVVTSINNEYQDKEYTVNIPAYWAYIGMSPAYSDIKYQQVVPQISIDSYYVGSFANAVHFNVGDELLLDYTVGTSHYQLDAWVTGSSPTIHTSIGDCWTCCHAFIVPRFPTHTTGWSALDTIRNVTVEVINSGAKNMLSETAETYTMLDNPIDLYGNLKLSLDSVISIKAKTFSDSNTRIVHNDIVHAADINPFVIGERGVYRVLSEYAYITNRNYSGTTSRNAGLFDPTSLYNLPGYDPAHCIQFPYNYMSPYGDPNWHIARTVTKWSPYGKEVENVDAVGNYSSAAYGYNEQLPTAVASNARQGEVMSDGFEDYHLLNYINYPLGFSYSPFKGYFGTTPLSPPSSAYNITQLTTSGLSIVSTAAHTGNYSLSVPTSSGGITGVYTVGVPINFNSYPGMVTHYNSYFPLAYSFSSINEYLPFMLTPGKKYVLSYWIKQSSSSSNITTYPISDSCGIKIDGAFYPLVKKSNIIDGWQQVEAAFNVPATVSTATLRLPAASYFVDDIRFFPSDANMKSFVYNPANEKVMATLDENNFATLYEYDQEGNLVRVKKETEKGIMTVSESRSGNPKQ